MACMQYNNSIKLELELEDHRNLNKQSDLRERFFGWATIRPERRFVPNSKKRQSQATFRPILKRRQSVPFVKSDNSSQIV